MMMNLWIRQGVVQHKCSYVLSIFDPISVELNKIRDLFKVKLLTIQILKLKQDLLIFKVKLCRVKEKKEERKYQLTKSDWLTDKFWLTYWQMLTDFYW